MIGDLDALLVLSLACGIAGVAVLVCGMGAVRDFMHGTNLEDPVDGPLLDEADDPLQPPVRVVDEAPARGRPAPAVVPPTYAEEPRTWVRVIEGDVTPKPARRVSTSTDEAPEPVHAGGRGLLERVLSGIAAIPDERTVEPSSDPALLEVAAAQASTVATGGTPSGHERVGAADDPGAGTGAASEPAAAPLPEWVPPVAPADPRVRATRGINRLAAVLDAEPPEAEPPEVDQAETSVERPEVQQRDDQPAVPLVAATGDGAEEPESGLGHLAALIDLNESRRTRRSSKTHRVGLRRNAEARSGQDEQRRKLPVGAERALLSIVEVQPDPRNVLALQRDPTAQVTITELDREAARAAFERDREEEAASRRRHPTAHRRSA